MNGPMRITSDSVGSPPGCTTVVRYFATCPLAVISRWISSHKRSRSAARRRRARGRELSQPFVARDLSGSRRELRRDQRLLQDRRVVVGSLARQTEHLGQSQRARFVAELGVQVADTQLVRGVRVVETLRRGVELCALLLGLRAATHPSRAAWPWLRTRRGAAGRLDSRRRGLARLRCSSSACEAAGFC